MSNPLAVFRKHQKVLLAVFGVLLMIVFTVGGLVTDYLGMGGAAGGENPEVVRWSGGVLRESDLQLMRYQRNQLRMFLGLVQSHTRERGGQPRVPSIQDTDAEVSLIESWLLATKAQQMGIVVVDEAILDYLEQLTNNTVPRSEFPILLRQSTGGRMSENQLFEALGTELLAQKLRMMAHSGGFPASPGAAWDYFNRLERRVEAQLVALPVARFVDQVSDPGEAEIREFYDRHKDQYANPYTAEPGFKLRRRMAFSFLKADYARFLESALADVTDAEVQEYYETHKNEFRRAELPASATPPADKAPPASEAAPESDAKPDQPPEPPEAESAPGADASPDTSPAPDPSDTSDPAEDTDDASPPPLPEMPSENPDGVKEVDPETKAESPEPLLPDDTEPQQLADDPADELPKQNDAPPDIAHPESTGEGPAPAKAEDVDAAEPPASGAAPAEADADGSETSESAVTAERPETTEPADTPLLPGADPAGPEEPAGTKEPGAADLGTLSVTPEEGEFKPLDQVREEIRRSLARPRAQEKLKEVLGRARSEMETYYREYVLWEIQRKNQPDTPQPPAPDFAQLGRKYGLIDGSVPLVDRVQVEEYEIGQAYELSFVQGQIGRTTFADIAFAEGAPLYRPATIAGGDLDSQFLFWKTDDQPETVPTLEAAREQVVRAWKMRKALDRARESAGQLAEEVHASGKGLAEFVGSNPEQQVIETGAFSWMTGGSVPMGGMGSPYLSSVPGVDLPGMKFMQDVCRQPVGGIAVTENQNETTVYLVQVTRESPTEEQRRERFLKSGVTLPLVQVASLDSGRILGQWYEGLEKEMGIEWLREPRDESREQ